MDPDLNQNDDFRYIFFNWKNKKMATQIDKSQAESELNR